MNKYIKINLKAPLIAWGNYTLNNTRTTAEFPYHSHMTGILCAAFGIDGQDFKSQKEIRDSFEYAVKEESNKNLKIIEDYQIIQPYVKLKDQILFNGLTRRSCNFRQDSNIDRKHYLCNAAYIALLRLTNKTVFTETEVIYALGNPFYTLYLGRKKCIPSQPLIGKDSIIEANDWLSGFKKVSSLPGRVWGFEPFSEQDKKFKTRGFPNYNKGRFYQEQIVYQTAIS